MLVIREYRPADGSQIEACLVELQEFERLIDPNLAEGHTMAKSYLARMFARCSETLGKVFVAEFDGRLVGFISIWARVKSDSLEEQDFEYAYISDLVVLADYRGRGIGRALLRRAEEHSVMQGATMLKVGVLADNSVARRLYHDAGFQEYEVILVKHLSVEVGEIS
jgi:ribosomal protein S18 acetylase RimI-like enzyme